MNKQEFIAGVKSNRDSDAKSIELNLIKPPGRNPSKRDIKMSEFYNSLNEDQKNTVMEIVKDSVDAGIWSFLTLLDNVGFIDDAENPPEFELYAIKDGECTLINDPDQEELHVLFSD